MARCCNLYYFFTLLGVFLPCYTEVSKGILNYCGMGGKFLISGHVAPENHALLVRLQEGRVSMKIFGRLCEKRAERRLIVEQEELRRQEQREKERFEKEKRDLEFISRTALMQNSHECFSLSSDFCKDLRIDDADVLLKSSGNPRLGERRTKVKVTSLRSTLTLIEVYSYRAKRTCQQILTVC